MNKMSKKALDVLDKVERDLTKLLQLTLMKASVKYVSKECSDERLSKICKDMEKIDNFDVEKINRYLNIIDFLKYPLGRSVVDYNDKVPIITDYSVVEKVLYGYCHFSDYEVGYILNKIVEFNNSMFSTQTDESVSYTPSSFADEGLDPEYAPDLLAKYFNEPEALPELIKEKVEKIVKKERAKADEVINAHSSILTFISRRNHTDEEYDEFRNLLVILNMPKKLQDVYIGYLKSKEVKVEKNIEEKVEKKEPVEEIKEEQIPKRYLKQRLKEILESETFDLNNIDEVRDILVKLSYPDSIKVDVLNDLYRKAKKNSAYYKFIIEKAKFMKAYTEKIKELQELRELYSASDDNNKKEIKTWQDEIYKEMEGILPIESDFELYRLSYRYDEKKED